MTLTYIYMQEDVNELLESFLALCLEQRQLSSKTELNQNQNQNQRKEELEACSMELAIKLFTKAAELERSGDISKGTHSHSCAS
jgi:hypothetical protein